MYGVHDLVKVYRLFAFIRLIHSFVFEVFCFVFVLFLFCKYYEYTFVAVKIEIFARNSHLQAACDASIIYRACYNGGA